MKIENFDNIFVIEKKKNFYIIDKDDINYHSISTSGNLIYGSIMEILKHPNVLSFKTKGDAIKKIKGLFDNK